MDEVESAGGPLICVESALAPQWLGIDGLSVKLEPPMPGVSTDYERTYKIGPDRYLKALRLKHGSALILGDRPMITGAWKNALGQVVIWRISFADEDDDLPRMLASLPESAFETPLRSLEFTFYSPKVVIFDSACPGDEAEDEAVPFEITPGRYQVTTHIVQPGPRTELVLHRFYRLI